jgi:hypothetical protein
MGKSTSLHLSGATTETINTFLEYTSKELFEMSLMPCELNQLASCNFNKSSDITESSIEILPIFNN